MGLFNFSNWLSKKQLQNYYFFDSSYIQPILDVSIERLYETQPHLRSVLDFLALNIAQLPLKVYENKDGIKRRIKTGLVYDLLKKPNCDQTTFEFIQQTVSELGLYDSVYWVVVPDSQSDSGWQIRVMPNKWIIEEVSSTPYSIDKIICTAENSSLGLAEIEGKNLIIFHGWKPNNPRVGVSPVESLRQTLAEQISSMEFRQSIWKNQGRFNQYISRPKDIEPMTSEQIEKFRQNFTDAYTRKGSKAGGMPVLEDGMEIKQAQFNAKEAQWLESVKLSLKTCASAYHVNPYFVGDTDGKTYASVKEASRSLYNDTLAPWLTRIEQRINQFLIPMIGEDSDVFVEFDLSAKLAGSFEEQASVLSSSIGAPWLTRNEGRNKLNLPPVEGGDELITPLNVTEGGLASPRDTASSSEPTITSNGDIEFKSDEGYKVKIKSTTLSTKPKKKDAEELEQIIIKHINRQKRAIKPKIKAYTDIWDDERWNLELADDLEPVIDRMSDSHALSMVKRMGVDKGEYSKNRTRKYLRTMAESRAQSINKMTKQNLLNFLDDEFEEDAEGSSFDGAFEKSENNAFSKAYAIACGVFAFATTEAISQCGVKSPNMTKTWVHNPSTNPRPEHEAMDGEEVNYYENFSNGCFRPHDDYSLGAEENANCHCSMEVWIP